MEICIYAFGWLSVLNNFDKILAWFFVRAIHLVLVPFFARLDTRYIYLALPWECTMQYLIYLYIITMICALQDILQD